MRRRNEKWFYLSMTVLATLITVTLIFVICRTGEAEALPSPDGAALIALDGDLKLSGAELDIRIADCIRADVVGMGESGAGADLTLPQIQADIVDVMLFDGWHLFHAQWEQIGDKTLHVRFRTEDLMKLDGTVGLYLVVLGKR